MYTNFLNVELYNSTYSGGNNTHGCLCSMRPGNNGTINMNVGVLVIKDGNINNDTLNVDDDIFEFTTMNFHHEYRHGIMSFMDMCIQYPSFWRCIITCEKRTVKNTRIIQGYQEYFKIMNVLVQIDGNEYTKYKEQHGFVPGESSLLDIFVDSTKNQFHKIKPATVNMNSSCDDESSPSDDVTISSKLTRFMSDMNNHKVYNLYNHQYCSLNELLQIEESIDNGEHYINLNYDFIIPNTPYTIHTNEGKNYYISKTKTYIEDDSNALHYTHQEDHTTSSRPTKCILKGGFLCNYTGSGKSRIMCALTDVTRDSRGPTLIIVPANLVTQWLDEIKTTNHNNLSVICLKNMRDITNKKKYNKKNIQDVDIVLISINLLTNTTYIRLLYEYMNSIIDKSRVFSNECAFRRNRNRTTSTMSRNITTEKLSCTRRYINSISDDSSQEIPPFLELIRWKRIVLDEIHLYHGCSKQMKALQCLSYFCNKIWGLSATPHEYNDSHMQFYRKLFFHVSVNTYSPYIHNSDTSFFHKCFIRYDVENNSRPRLIHTLHNVVLSTTERSLLNRCVQQQHHNPVKSVQLCSYFDDKYSSSMSFETIKLRHIDDVVASLDSKIEEDIKQLLNRNNVLERKAYELTSQVIELDQKLDHVTSERSTNFPLRGDGIEILERDDSENNHIVGNIDNEEELYDILTAEIDFYEYEKKVCTDSRTDIETEKHKNYDKINELQRLLKFTKNSLKENTDPCPICMEDYVNNCDVSSDVDVENITDEREMSKRHQVVFKCGHSVCKACLDNMIHITRNNRNGYVTCPTCRVVNHNSNVYEITNDEIKRYGSKFIKIYNVLQDILKDGKQVVVYTQWVSHARRLLICLKEKGINVNNLEGNQPTRNSIVQKFNDNNLNVLICSSQMGIDGVDLSKSCNLLITHAIVANKKEDMLNIEKQVVGRIDRISQNESEINVHHFIADDTIEEEIWKYTHDKMDLHDRLEHTLQQIDNSRLYS